MIGAALLLSFVATFAADVPRPDLTAASRPVRDALTASAKDVEMSPASATTWGHYAMLLHAHSCPVQANLAYAEAHRLDPADFRWAYFHGIVLMKTEPAAALERYDRAIEMDGAYPGAHIRRALALGALGRDDEAQQALVRALELEPKNISAHIHLGQIEVKLGNIDRAIHHLELARRSRPRDTSLLSALAQAYARQGDRDRAREFAALAREGEEGRIVDETRFNEVVMMSVTRQAFLQRSGVLFSSGNIKGAQAELQKALDLGHDPGVIHSLRARQYLVAGDAPNCILAARAALDAGHDEAALDAVYAQALIRLNRLDEADAVLRPRLTAEAPPAVTLLIWAEIAEASGDDAAAIERLSRALAIEDSRRARQRRALAQSRLGHIELALRELNELTRSAPHDVSAWLALGDVHRAANDSAAALVAYDRAAQNATSAAPGRRAVSLLLEGSEFAEARNRLRALRQQWPQNPNLINELAWLLATCPDDTIRDGTQAISLVRPLVKRTRRREPALLDTLAAAQAEAGSFTIAVRIMTEAINLLGPDVAAARRRQYEERRNQYARGAPWRDVPEFYGPWLWYVSIGQVCLARVQLSRIGKKG